MNCSEITDTLDRMATELALICKKTTPVMIGIKTGGLWVADYLHKKLAIETPLGELNIAFYRDDFSRIGLHPRIGPSKLPFNIENQHILLIDDILFTGRTIRAAMNEIFDYGRPAKITLCVLIDRGGRELPIDASIIGTTIKLNPNQHIKLTGPAPLVTTVYKN